MIEVIIVIFMMLIVFIPILYRINKRIYELEECMKSLSRNKKQKY